MYLGYCCLSTQKEKLNTSSYKYEISSILSVVLPNVVNSISVCPLERNTSVLVYSNVPLINFFGIVAVDLFHPLSFYFNNFF